MKFAIGAVVVGLLLTAVAAALAADRNWQAKTKALVDRLDEGKARSTRRSTLRSGDIGSLPPAVARYFHAVLGNTEVRVRRAKIRWRGEFLVRPDAGGWAPFEATQVFSVEPPGFVWDARMRMGPGVTTYVRDGFVDGHGSMRGALLGAITVVSPPSTPQLDAGALHRYLAEAVWFPTALLPGSGVTWTPLTDSSAQAHLHAGGSSVTLEFRFGGDSLVESVFTAARFRDLNGANVPTPWEGRFLRYEERDGMRIPTLAEVAWLLPERRLVYWRGSPVEVAYTWAER